MRANGRMRLLELVFTRLTVRLSWAIVATLMAVGSIAALASDQDDMLSYLESDWKDRQLQIRESVNGASVFHMNDEQNTVYIFLSRNSYFLSGEHTVRVAGFDQISPAEKRSYQDYAIYMGDSKYNPKTLEVSLDGGPIGSATILVTSDAGELSRDQMNRFFATAFVLEEGGDDFDYYVMNRQSGMIHSSLCDHLPPDSLQMPFPSIVSDDNDLWCPSCFAVKSDLPGWKLEQMIGQQAAGQYLTQFRVRTDVEKADKLEEVVAESRTVR